MTYKPFSQQSSRVLIALYFQCRFVGNIFLQFLHLTTCLFYLHRGHAEEYFYWVNNSRLVVFLFSFLILSLCCVPLSTISFIIPPLKVLCLFVPLLLEFFLCNCYQAVLLQHALERLYSYLSLGIPKTFKDAQLLLFQVLLLVHFLSFFLVFL